MSQSYDHPIDPVAHRRRCRAALEQLAVPGPQLPFERPRHYVDRQGRAYAWAAGHYVSID